MKSILNIILLSFLVLTICSPVYAQSSLINRSTATLTNVASSATSVTCLSAATGRGAAFIFNDSAQVLYIKFGETASATSFTVKVAAGGFYEVPLPAYLGRIDCIWASADGFARVTEVK